MLQPSYNLCFVDLVKRQKAKSANLNPSCILPLGSVYGASFLPNQRLEAYFHMFRAHPTHSGSSLRHQIRYINASLSDQALLCRINPVKSALYRLDKPKSLKLRN